MTTQSPLSDPLNVGDLLDRAFRLYRARFGLFLLTAAVFLLPIGIVPAVLVMFEEVNSFPLLVPGAIFLLNSAPTGFTHLAVILIFIVAYILAALVFTIQCNSMLHGRSPAAREVLRAGPGRLLTYAATTAVKWMVVIIAVATAVYLAVFAVSGLILFRLTLEAVTSPLTRNLESDNSLDHAVEMISYFLSLALPTVILGALPVFLLARLFVAPAALVIERTGLLDSLLRSWKLSQGRSWRMMGYVMLLFLLLRLFNYAPATVFQLAIPRFLPGLDLGLQTGIAIAIHSVTSTISAPAAIITTVLLYYDLRIRSGEDNDQELPVAQPEAQVARQADQDAL